MKNIEFNEKDLPDVELDNSQIKNILTSLTINISDSIQAHKDLEIDTSLSNILKIYNDLGSDKDTMLHNVKYAKVLENLIIPAFNKKYSPHSEDLILSKFCMIGTNNSVKNTPPSWQEIPFYVQIYITKNVLYLYYFNHIYKLINTHILPISDIKNASIIISSSLSSDYYLDIFIKSSKYPTLVGINIINSPDKIVDEISDALLSLGVPNNPAIRTDKSLRGVQLFIIFFILLIGLIATLSAL